MTWIMNKITILKDGRSEEEVRALVEQLKEFYSIDMIHVTTIDELNTTLTTRVFLGKNDYSKIDDSPMIEEPQDNSDPYWRRFENIRGKKWAVKR